MQISGVLSTVMQPLVNPERSTLNEELEFVKHAREGPVHRLRSTLKQKLEDSDDAFAWVPKESWNGIEQRVKTLMRQRDDDFAHLHKYSKDFDELEVMIHKLIEVVDRQTALLQKCSCHRTGSTTSKSELERELEALKATHSELSASHHKLTLKVKTERDNTAKLELLTAAKEEQMQQAQLMMKKKWKTEKKQVKQLMQEIEELRASRGAAGGDSGVATESANVDSITVEKKVAQAQANATSEFEQREKLWLETETKLNAQIKNLKLELDSAKTPDMIRLENTTRESLEALVLAKNHVAIKCGEIEELAQRSLEQTNILEDLHVENADLRTQLRVCMIKYNSADAEKISSAELAKDQISIMEGELKTEKQRHDAKEKKLEKEIEKLQAVIDAKAIPTSQLVMKYADTLTERNAFSSLCAVLKKQFDERHNTLRSSYQLKMDAWEMDKEELQQAQYDVRKLADDVAHRDQMYEALKQRVQKLTNMRKLDQNKIHELEQEKHTTERDLASVRNLIDSLGHGGRSRAVSAPTR